MNKQAESIAKASFIILVVNFSSRILGFLREILIAYFFGAKAIVDSFLVANVLPTTIAGLIGGALTTVFIPVFIEKKEKEGEETAWEGARSVFGVSLVYLFTMLSISYAVAPFFIKAIAPGFAEERLRLALSMSNVMLPSIVFLGMLGLLTGIFNSYRLFTIPALAGLSYNVCLILFMVLAKDFPLIGLGLGNTMGIIVQVMILFLIARKTWSGWGIGFSFSHPMLKKVWRLMVPIFIGTGVGYLNLIVDRIFASLLPEGTISAMNFAVRIKEIPIGLFVLAISQAIYPVTASQFAHGKIEEFRNLFSRSLETLWLFMLPCTAGLLILARETVRFLFERGAFTAQATSLTAQALFFYALGLFFRTSLDLTARVFYSFQDTKTPVRIGIMGLVLNIVLNAVLVRTMAHRGLALATSISSAFMFTVLIEILRRRMGGIGGRTLLKNLIKIVLATTVMGLFVMALKPLARSNLGYIASVTLGALVYAGAVLVFKPKSAETILSRTLKRLLG
ncbi:murein biosynthesis integral membrane protein MurJ [Pseudothermotoga sp.]|nr:murein biosynthesis integral membrane protein MurJ [Pseudothermotoga sp.]MDW8140633.1 murein biosynthesis integral membrane protein MurJ [Pseudothermotoga sp.]